MEEFYVRVWDGPTVNLSVKMVAPRLPQPGEEVTIDLDHPLTHVVGGAWMGIEPLEGRHTYTIAKPWRPDTEVNGLPILDCQLAYEH